MSKNWCRLARLTGGRGNVAGQATELEGLFDEISQQLKNQYLVQYHTDTPGERSVIVKAEAEGIAKTDERLVFVPPLDQPATPTPTPLPPELTVTIMEATKDKPEKGDLEILMAISEPERAGQAELFVDDISRQVLAQPPLEKFVLQLDELTPGRHMLRIEVTDDLGRIATDKREISISEPPTPVPTPVPPPPPEPTASYNTVALGLIATACLLLLVIFGVGIYFMLRQRKQSQAAPPVTSAPMPVAPPPRPVPEQTMFETHDELAHRPPVQQDPFQTIDEILVINAGLIAIQSETVQGQAFRINKPEVTLGRDAGSTQHDINIPDKSVSRRHAKIKFDGRNYRIFDTGSSNGTQVNGALVSAEGIILQSRDVIQLGKHTRLRFNTGKSGVEDDPYRTMDDELDDDDPFKTADDA